MVDTERYLNQSVINAFSILEAFNEKNTALSSQELSDLLEMNTSLTWRLLQTLTHMGYLDQTEKNKYRLSYKALSFSKAILNTSLIRKEAFPHLKKLAEEVKLNVILGVLDKNEVVYLIRIPSPDVPDNYFHVGRHVPLYCTASGKILLAYQPGEIREEILQGLQLKKLTPTTITDKAQLRQQLDEIRNQGYARDEAEYLEQTRCLAVPIRDNSGSVVAGISISTTRIHRRERIEPENYINELSKTASIISNELGQSLYNPLDDLKNELKVR